MKKNRGMTLLEVIFAIVLLGLIIPPFAKMLISHLNLNDTLLVRETMYDVANDVKSFVKLADYDVIYNLAKNSEFLSISEASENDLVAREFVPFSPIGNNQTLVKFELHSGSVSIDEDCALPLQCKIYHIKNAKSGLGVDKLLKNCDTVFFVSLLKLR